MMNYQCQMVLIKLGLSQGLWCDVNHLVTFRTSKVHAVVLSASVGSVGRESSFHL